MDDLSRMIEQKQVVLNLAHPEYFVSRRVQQPSNRAMLQLNRSLRFNPPIYSEFSQLSQVYGRPVIRVMSTSLTQTISNATHCPFVFIGTGEQLIYSLITSMRMDSRLFDRLDELVRRNLEQLSAGLDRTREKQRQAYADCRRVNDASLQRKSGEPIPLALMAGAFILFAVGSAAAICVQIGELAVKVFSIYRPTVIICLLN